MRTIIARPVTRNFSLRIGWTKFATQSEIFTRIWMRELATPRVSLRLRVLRVFVRVQSRFLVQEQSS